MAEAYVCVAVKPVAPVLDVDWTTGRTRLETRHLVRTPADEAACAVGRLLADALAADLVVVGLAGPAAHGALAAAASGCGARALRVVLGDDVDDVAPEAQWPSGAVAHGLAAAVAGARVVVCGDASGDRGSGTVPGHLAHRLGVPQALCLRTAQVAGGRVAATRRLDGGRRERLSVGLPCVVSVESGAATLARATLEAALNAPGVDERHVPAPPGARRGDPPGTVIGPYRPRASDLRPPSATDPVRRAVELAGSLVAGDPPEVLRADPEAAADAILERLARWGLR